MENKKAQLKKVIDFLQDIYNGEKFFHNRTLDEKIFELTLENLGGFYFDNYTTLNTTLIIMYDNTNISINLWYKDKEELYEIKKKEIEDDFNKKINELNRIYKGQKE